MEFDSGCIFYYFQGIIRSGRQTACQRDILNLIIYRSHEAFIQHMLLHGKLFKVLRMTIMQWAIYLCVNKV